MKSLCVLLALSIVCLCYVSVRGECGEAAKDSEEGDVKTWFKNIGCSIKKGAEDIGESAKPWADKIGTSAKDFGHTVAQKYDAIKHKLTDENVASSTSTVPRIIDGPTEKVPLAPLAGHNDAAASQAAGVTENTTPHPSKSATPMSIDDRFLFQLNECPPGQIKDHTNKCRPQM